jgi:hypothetical protein
MVKVFDINSFEERKQFKIKLQIALLNNTLKIKTNSKNPEKYDEYIGERIEKIRNLLDTTAKFTITDGDKVLYSSEIIKNS